MVGAGVWRAPGECSEVASALVQALRNRIERWLEFLEVNALGYLFTNSCNFVFMYNYAF